MTITERILLKSIFNKRAFEIKCGKTTLDEYTSGPYQKDIKSVLGTYDFNVDIMDVFLECVKENQIDIHKI